MLYTYLKNTKIHFINVAITQLPEDYSLMNFMSVVMPSLWYLGYFSLSSSQPKIYNLPQLSYGWIIDEVWLIIIKKGMNEFLDRVRLIKHSLISWISSMIIGIWYESWDLQEGKFWYRILNITDKLIWSTVWAEYWVEMVLFSLWKEIETAA